MTFGEFFNQKRNALGISMRAFCIKHGYDSGNISKLERGVLAPPRSEEKLHDYAKALGIKRGTEDYCLFFDLATATNKVFQVKYVSDQKLLSKLPEFFRIIDSKRLTEEKLNQLIEIASK